MNRAEGAGLPAATYAPPGMVNEFGWTAEERVAVIKAYLCTSQDAVKIWGPDCAERLGGGECKVGALTDRPP